jgi:hypothetical protein
LILLGIPGAFEDIAALRTLWRTIRASLWQKSTDKIYLTSWRSKFGQEINGFALPGRGIQLHWVAHDEELLGNFRFSEKDTSGMKGSGVNNSRSMLELPSELGRQ